MGMISACVWTIRQICRTHDLVAIVLHVPRSHRLRRSAPCFPRHHAPLEVVLATPFAHYVAAVDEAALGPVGHGADDGVRRAYELVLRARRRTTHAYSHAGLVHFLFAAVDVAQVDISTHIAQHRLAAERLFFCRRGHVCQHSPGDVFCTVLVHVDLRAQIVSRYFWERRTEHVNIPRDCVVVESRASVASAPLAAWFQAGEIRICALNNGFHTPLLVRELLVLLSIVQDGIRDTEHSHEIWCDPR